jgi:hypothetical protein
MAAEIIPAIEREYAERVGAERYSQARTTLEELVAALDAAND